MTNTQLDQEASAVDLPDDTFIEPEVPDTEFLEENNQSDSDSDASSSDDDDQDEVQLDENIKSDLEKFKK